MKKLVSGILAGISVMSSIPNVGATHFTSETSESQSKSLDWKSALLGRCLVGGIGIPVAAVISALIGKSVERAHSLFTPADDKGSERLDQLLEEKEDESSGFFKQYLEEETVKSLEHLDNLMKSDEYGATVGDDLDFRKMFSVYKGNNCNIVMPPRKSEYDIVLVLCKNFAGEYGPFGIVYDYRESATRKGICCWLMRYVTDEWVKQDAELMPPEFVGVLLGSPKMTGPKGRVIGCRGYKVGQKTEEPKAK